jgi:DNA-directed RNA polymerase subunit RPC12/RpoP
MNKNNQLDERIQKCLNPKCGAILFVSGEMATDTDARGVDRDINIMHDEKGDYIECPTCGEKHKIKYFPSTPGGVMQWSIDGLRE